MFLWISFSDIACAAPLRCTLATCAVTSQLGYLGLFCTTIVTFGTVILHAPLHAPLLLVLATLHTLCLS